MGHSKLHVILRGTENFLMDMAIDPDFARDLLEKIGNFQDALYRNAMEAGGQYFDMIELPGDDYASNVSTIISPTMFRKLIKPILARFISTIRFSRPGIKIMFHSDGLITPLLDDLIEIGIDVIHPLEPLEDMNFIEIKRRYGHKISFLGGIDIRHALPGSRSEILKEVQTRI